MPGVLTGLADRPLYDSNISNSIWCHFRLARPLRGLTRRHCPLVDCAESPLAHYDPIGWRAGGPASGMHVARMCRSVAVGQVVRSRRRPLVGMPVCGLCAVFALFSCSVHH